MEHEFRGYGFVSLTRIVCICALALVAALSASPARANTVVVAPPNADMTVAVDTVDTATNELMRLIRVQGFDVISPGQASISAEDAQQGGTFPAHLNPHECRSVECALEYRRLFDASFTVQLLLSGIAGKLRTVTVTITESANATFTGSAQVQGGDLKAAVRAAYGSAREKHVSGEGPWLTISGGPAGAQVLVDDQEYGTLPIERRFLSSGEHRVVVRAEGHTAQTFTLKIPARADHEERLDVSLVALGGKAGGGPKLDRTWDYVVGSALAVAGGVHLGFGIHQHMQQDKCAERYEDGTCKDYYGDTDGVSQERLLMGLGAAGIAAGGIWMGVGPIARLKLRADKRSASLGFQGTF